MKQVIVKLESLGTYSQSKYIDRDKFPRLNKGKELDDAYENRIWRERLHVDKDGYIYIPNRQFLNSLREAAKYLSIKVPGKGKNLYTKHFEAGVSVDISARGIKLPIKKEDCDHIRVMVPPDGRVGGTKRVPKNFPIIPSWSGEVTFHILDEIITPDIFEQVLSTSGNLIGIGYWRPIKRGEYGRFKIADMKWVE